MTSERSGLVEDRGGLDHLDHEGRAAAGESSAAPTRENSRSTTPIRAASPARRAHLREDAISAFWRRKVDLPAMFGPVSSQMRPAFVAPGGAEVAVVGDEGAASRRSACSTTGWRPPSTAKASARRPPGRHIVARRQRGERRRDVERGERLGARLIAVGAAITGAHSRRRLELERQRPVGRRRRSSPPARPSSVVVKRTWPASVWRWMKVALSGGANSLSPCCADLDEIAEHVVVLDLERADAGLLGVARLQRWRSRGGFVAQPRAPRRASAS
jgi:hypothetical protein